MKRRFGRTNKKDADAQLVAQEVISTTIRHMADELHEIGVDVPVPPQAASQVVEDEARDPSAALQHHSIAAEQRNAVFLRQLLSDHPGDPALSSFVPDLQAHLKARLRMEDPSWPETALITLDRDCLFAHATARINFTTYDLRRGQDIIHIGTDKCFVMVNAPDTSDDNRYPWMYAQVLGVYHANVLRPGTASKVRMEFMWVRWLQRDTTLPHSANHFRLPRVSFAPATLPDAFGFIDPAAVLRATHLIPGFHYGRTFALLGPSIARAASGDWRYYYVGRFVDHDIAMRYLGIGIGHRGHRARTTDVLDTAVSFASGLDTATAAACSSSATVRTHIDAANVGIAGESHSSADQDEDSTDAEQLISDSESEPSSDGDFEDEL